jgi:hypothetical protein
VLKNKPVKQLTLTLFNNNLKEKHCPIEFNLSVFLDLPLPLKSMSAGGTGTDPVRELVQKASHDRLDGL